MVRHTQIPTLRMVLKPIPPLRTGCWSFNGTRCPLDSHPDPLLHATWRLSSRRGVALTPHSTEPLVQSTQQGSSTSAQMSSHEPVRPPGYSFSYLATNVPSFLFLFTPADGWGRPCHCKLVRPFRPVIVLILIYSLFFLDFFYTSEWVAGTLLQNVDTSPLTSEPPTTW